MAVELEKLVRWRAGEKMMSVAPDGPARKADQQQGDREAANDLSFSF